MFAITILQRAASFVVLFVVGLLIVVVGRFILNQIGRSSPARFQHGQFVLRWMIAGFAIGAAFGVYLIDNVQYWQMEADGGMAGFGLLIGWVIGMIHGTIDAIRTKLSRNRGSVS